MFNFFSKFSIFFIFFFPKFSDFFHNSDSGDDVWEENWEDDNIEDDFSLQLRAELEKKGHKLEPLVQTKTEPKE